MRELLRASRFRRITWPVCELAVGAMLAACGGADGGPTATTSTGPTPALTTMSVTLSAATLSVGQTGTASAAGFDQNHAAIATGTVTWTSSAPGVATVDASGAITTVAPGQTQIIASANGITGQAPLTVIAAGTSNAVPLTLSAAGQSTAFLNSPDPNVALTVQAGAQFLIAVVNTSASPSAREDFTITGTASTTASALAQGASGVSSTAPLVAPRPLGDLGPVLPREIADLRRMTQNHLAVLDENRRIFATFGSPRAAWARIRSATQGAGVRASIAPIVPAIGAVNRVYVKRALGGSCTSVDSIGARTVAIGQHILVLADTNSTAWPTSLRPDSSFYQTFADEYDQVTFPHILANIGDPLAFDASLSSAGRVTVTITPNLNGLSGSSDAAIVAFVNGCDFFPFAASGPNADRSNQTEMFYSWVPGSNGFSVATWEKSLRATAAHETKHIVSYADRILNNSPVFEEIWLEEGLAQASSEIWERAFNQATWKGHATFLQTVACEINLGPNAPCDLQNDRPVATVVSHFPFLFDYLQTESSSQTEGLGLDTPANYGAGWTIARWAIDQYAAGGEAAFIKALINEPQLSGLANLSAHTGESIASLLVYWNLATAIFQTPTYTASDVRTTIPSFDFANIFRIGQTGLTCSGTPCGLFTQSGTPVYPIQPTPLATGAVSATMIRIPGTSAAFFLLTGAAATTEQLHLVGTTGAPLSAGSALRTAIIRVK
jgi:hypothetical protein